MDKRLVRELCVFYFITSYQCHTFIYSLSPSQTYFT